MRAPSLRSMKRVWRSNRPYRAAAFASAHSPKCNPGPKQPVELSADDIRERIVAVRFVAERPVVVEHDPAKPHFGEAVSESPVGRPPPVERAASAKRCHTRPGLAFDCRRLVCRECVRSVVGGEGPKVVNSSAERWHARVSRIIPRVRPALPTTKNA